MRKIALTGAIIVSCAVFSAFPLLDQLVGNAEELHAFSGQSRSGSRKTAERWQRRGRTSTPRATATSPEHCS